MFTQAALPVTWNGTQRPSVLLALCWVIALAGGAGCVFDKSGFPSSENQNTNQNGNQNGNQNNNNSPGCGDGIVTSAELCDDGNLNPGDGCNDQCTVEVGWQCTRDDPSVCTTVCGDGIFVEGHEACDDGNLSDDDGCSALCDVEGYYACSGDPSECSCVVYVSLIGTSTTPDGSSWTEAYRTVPDGITRATFLLPSQVACEVWVAEGTYFIYEQSAADTVTLQSQVGIYGGFSGVETARDQRNWLTRQTVLDGNNASVSGLQVQHVVSANGVAGATLDGFTVTGGFVPTDDIDGAGIMLVDSKVTVANCVIRDNLNADDGGGLFAQGGSLLLTDSEITDNTSRDDGAGVVIRGVGSTAIIRRCLFSRNIGGDRGGGLAVHEGMVAVVNSVFWSNAAPNGGGASLGTAATVSFTNCTFFRNQSGPSPGGGIRNDFFEPDGDELHPVGRPAPGVGNHRRHHRGVLLRLTVGLRIYRGGKHQHGPELRQSPGERLPPEPRLTVHRRSRLVGSPEPGSGVFRTRGRPPHHRQRRRHSPGRHGRLRIPAVAPRPR